MKFHLEIVAALLLVGMAQAAPQNESQSQRTATQRDVAANVTYEPQLAGHGKGPGGSRYSFQDYRASDGVGVSVRSEHFATAKRASAAFKRRLLGASRVVERGDAQEGERAVLIYNPRKSAPGSAAIVRLKGSVILTIESPSLEHALDFESRG